MKKATNISKIQKRTKYDLGKQTKRDNFTFLNQNYCREGQTVLLGDSITEIFNVTDFFADYTAETDLAVYNRGISGDTSDRLLERLHDNVICIKPKNIIMLIGTNDLGVGAKPDFTVENIEKIIDIIKRECPNAKLILQAIYPVNSHINRGMVGIRKNSDILEINSRLKEIAKLKDIVFVDFTDDLSDKNGRFDRRYTYDGLHPNAVGYSVVIDKLIELIKE